MMNKMLLKQIIREELKSIISDRKLTKINEGSFSELEIIKQESNGFEEFVRNVFADDRFKSMKKDPEFLSTLKSLYGDAKVVSLDQLKFDDLVRMYPNNYNDVHFTRQQPDGKEGPYYRDSLSFPNPDDSSTQIGDMKALENWKQETKKRFGNINIMLNPYAKERWNKVKIEDDKFSQSQSDYVRGKASALDAFGTTE